MSQRSKRSVPSDEPLDLSPKKKRPHIEDSDSDDSGADENDESVIESSLRDTTLVPLKAKGNLASDPVAGVIRRISVSNFMCHNHLEVVLGSHVNFIVGRNGSGKSAVVTALVVGLGGKASVTSRGSSVKNFVKTGKRSAWVEIVLNNKGKDSYKPHIYGDKIIVNRRFNAEGGSTYAIKSDKGQHISNRRDELCRITDHLNIQVDNPVSILNQDTSRNFLNSKSAGDKFKFFMKATQLEQMSSDYDQVRSSKDSSKSIIVDKEKTLPKMKGEVRVWETKFKNMTAVSELKVKVKKLKHEMAWAIVNAKERGLEPMEKSLKVEVDALPKFKRKVDDSKEQVDAWETRHKEVQEKLLLCSNEVKALEPALQEKKIELQRAKEKLQPVSMDLKGCDRELNITNRDCKLVQERINELKATASHDYESERVQREEQIAKLETQLEKLAAEDRVKEHEVEQFRGAVAKHKTELAQIETQMKAKDKTLRDVQNTLNDLVRAKNDRLQRFGAWMPNLVEQIQRSRNKFHKIPLGPLGASFDLVDPKWALAVEVCLKGLVSSFVCHDHHDMQILLTLFQGCPKNRRPTIIVSTFAEQPYNVSHTRCQSDRYESLLDVIRSDNPVVVNTLIDQRSIEKILLIEDSSEARRVMSGKNPPQNARECFTIEGDQMICGDSFRYYSNDKGTVRFLMADVAEQIRRLEPQQQQLRKDREGLINQREAHQHEIAKNAQEEKRLLTQRNKIKESGTRIRFDITELKNMEDPMPVDVTTLEEEEAGFKQKIQELTEKRKTCMAAKTAADQDLATARDSYARLEAEIREQSDSGLPLRDEINQAKFEVEKAKNEKKHYMAKLKEQENKIESMTTDVTKYKQELEADTATASEICPPVSTRRTSASIEKEIEQIKKRIEEEEQQHGNEKEILETYQDKKASYDKVQSEVRQLKNYLHKLDEVMERRQQSYLQMRKDIAARTKYYFLLQLHQREFQGKMNFDFTKQILDILVNPCQDTSSGNATLSEAKDLKSLSGGERSFSTVCFILSLWEAMEAPFRCLDEFDVFMDMVNRRVSMDMMLETADMHKDMQFVFLTPQDMRSVRKMDNVKIFRMPDPERSQKMLNFTHEQTTSS